MSPGPSAQSQDRREHIRVMDAIGLDIQSVASDPASTKVASALVNRYALNGYADVSRDFPEVVQYIDFLEERIRQLQLHSAVLQEAPTHKVILSSDGLAFADDRLLQPGTVVSLELTLFPQLQRISCEGVVVSVGDVSDLVHDSQHSYRLVFTSISAEDTAVIAEHILSVRRTVRQFSTA